MKKHKNEKSILKHKKKQFNANLLLHKVIQISSFININENIYNCNINTLDSIDYIKKNKNEKQSNNSNNEFNLNVNNFLNLKENNFIFYNNHIKNKINKNYYENLLSKKENLFEIKNIECKINIPLINEKYSNNINKLKLINKIKRNRLKELKDKLQKIKK